VEGYHAQGTPVTLRQVFYRLGSLPDLYFPLNQGYYKRLSAKLVEARRDEDNPFPDLVDYGREIHEMPGWDTEAEFFEAVIESWARRRNAGQEIHLFVGVEKDTLRAQALNLARPLGIPVVVLKGYGSETYAKEVSQRIAEDGRPAVLLYFGDLDPSGENLQADWESKSGPWAIPAIRLGINIGDRSPATSGLAYDLPWIEAVKSDGSPKEDSRWPAFAAKYDLDPAVPVQCEVEALDPVDLQAKLQAGIDAHFDYDIYEAVTAEEDEQRERIRRYLDGYDG
jgi:hypothetical protein